MGDLEGRGGGRPRGPHDIRILPVDRPCTRRVTYRSTGGIIPTLTTAQHSFLVEEEYKGKVFT